MSERPYRVAIGRAPFRLACCLLVVFSGSGVRAQPIPTAVSPPPQATSPEPPKDPLGRGTPRDTVVGFMSAAQKENNDLAPLYLNTGLRPQAAVDLAHKLYVVLDRRLPARLTELSDRPEGSLANPLKPDQDVVGTISTASGPLDIVVERVSRDRSAPIWLFSRKTLDAIPDVYDEINLVPVDRYLPGFLTKPRLGGIRVFDWLMLAVAIPLFYTLMGLLSRVLAPAIALWHRRHGAPEEPAIDRLPGSIRLLLVPIAIHWFMVTVEVPFAERQFWTVIQTLLAIAAIGWLLLQLNAAGERYVHRRLRSTRMGEFGSLLRLGRRIADAVVVSAGVLIALRYLGADPTAALTGLGIGGIAVALAAQKTLENVIGGLSIIFDKAVQVGDFLKVGKTMGTVDYIGLRSTRIRTLDRTIVSVPNGQIAAMGIETLSSRDKFWFHHFVGLLYETTPEQIRSVTDGIQHRLVGHPAVDISSIRVRFLRFGASSLDLEVSAYVLARDWARFLEIQQELLLAIMEIVRQAGTRLALPSQMLHFDWSASMPVEGWARAVRPSGLESQTKI
jgi:MscS family membrane protein